MPDDNTHPLEWLSTDSKVDEAAPQNPWKHDDPGLTPQKRTERAPHFIATIILLVTLGVAAYIGISVFGSLAQHSSPSAPLVVIATPTPQLVQKITPQQTYGWSNDTYTIVHYNTTSDKDIYVWNWTINNTSNTWTNATNAGNDGVL
jgi:hypothetical protein